jgi:hypothetical protein
LVYIVVVGLAAARSKVSTEDVKVLADATGSVALTRKRDVTSSADQKEFVNVYKYQKSIE